MPALYGFPTLDTYAFMHARAPPSFKFQPFDFEAEFGFEFSTKPRHELKPEERKTKLHEPRPTRPRVAYNALKHFEEIAPFWKDIHRVARVTSPVAIESRLPTAKPRPAHPDALSPNDRGTLLTSERAIGAPIRTRPPVFTRPTSADLLVPAPPAPALPGLAALSPGFFDRANSDSTKGRSRACAPSPPSFNHFAGLPARPPVFFRPPSSPHTVVHDAITEYAHTRPSSIAGPTNERPNSIPSTNPTIASQCTGEGIHDEETEALVGGADEDDALTYFSEDEVDILEDNLNFEDNDETEDEDTDTFYTASERSGYFADSESTWSDDNNEAASNGHKFYATSPVVSLLSISSTGSSASTSASLAVPSTPRSQQMPLPWTVGMPGDAIQSHFAAEKQTSAEEAQRHKGD